MTTYASHELIPSSVFAKQFGSYLAQIKDSAVEKLAILKNNKVEAVLVSKEEYERMHIAMSNPYKTISHEQMMKNIGINPSEEWH